MLYVIPLVSGIALLLLFHRTTMQWKKKRVMQLCMVAI